MKKHIKNGIDTIKRDMFEAFFNNTVKEYIQDAEKIPGMNLLKSFAEIILGFIISSFFTSSVINSAWSFHETDFENKEVIESQEILTLLKNKINNINNNNKDTSIHAIAQSEINIKKLKLSNNYEAINMNNDVINEENKQIELLNIDNGKDQSNKNDSKY